MANFNTHLFIATAGSSVAAFYLVEKQFVDLINTPWLILMGAIGGLLPDIDSDNTKQVKIVFLLLAIFCTFSLLSGNNVLHNETGWLLPTNLTTCKSVGAILAKLMTTLVGKCIPYTLLLLGIGTFITVRYLLLYLFKKLTSHRGVFHSLLAALFFTVLTTNISFHLFQYTNLFAWLSGIFIGLGFIIHLLLDEIYSVDLSNTKLKRSFGTALKLYNYKNGYASMLMFICLLALYSLTPVLHPSFLNIYY